MSITQHNTNTHRPRAHAFKKHIKKVLALLLVCFVLVTLLFPPLSFQVGNIFFGKVNALYNLQLAQFFYRLSAHPITPLPPPQYAHYQLARTYFIEGDFFGALKEEREELELYPKSTLTYYMLGLTYGYLNLTKEAIDAFSHYIEAYPTTWAAKNDKAWLQFREGDIRGALLTIELAALSQPSNPWLANTYGAMLLNSGRLLDARNSFERGLSQVNLMTEDDWGYAYPGNDPRIYSTGLSAMKKSLSDNLQLTNEKLKARKQNLKP